MSWTAPNYAHRPLAPLTAAACCTPSAACFLRRVTTSARACNRVARGVREAQEASEEVQAVIARHHLGKVYAACHTRLGVHSVLK